MFEVEPGKANYGRVVDGAASSVKAAEGRTLHTVPLVRLDTYCKQENLSGSLLVKIDVDGHEHPVISGAAGIASQVDCLIVEAQLHEIKPRIDIVSNTLNMVLWDIVDLSYYHGHLTQVDLVFLSWRLRSRDEFRPWQTKSFDWKDWQSLRPVDEA
jgi:hypothetical protein